MSKEIDIIDFHILDEYVENIDKVETLCRYFRSVEINEKSIRDLEKILNLLEMQEECIRATRRILILKQSNYYMRYLKTK